MLNRYLYRRAATLGVALLVFTAVARLDAQAPEPLFSDTETPGLSAPAIDTRPFVVRSRTATLQLVALERALASPATSGFTLNLFDDATFPVTFERVEDSGFGPRTWTGHITSSPLSTVSLTLNGDVVTGMVTDGTTLFEISGVSGAAHRIVQMDTSLMPIDRDIVVTLPAEEGQDPAGPAAPALSQPALSTVDIFVYYSAALTAQLGSGGVSSLIAQYIANANTAYARSGIDGQLRLVGTQELPASVEGANPSSLLSAFATTPAVLNQRDASNADLVALLVGAFAAPSPTSITCGIGYLGFVGSTNAAFSVTASRSECVHTFAHEVGHNLGGQHATEDGVEPPSTQYPAYARGFKAPNHAFRTIMAYECQTLPSCPRVLNFSNPAVLEGGQPTGTSSARNASRFSELFPQVAAYRAGGATPQPPGAPQNLQAITNGLNLTLQWQHASGGPSNYVVVAGNGPGLSNLGQVSVGLATTVSGTLPPGQYFVRVFAQSAAGTGPASNEVSFTLGVGAPPGPPRNLVASVAANTISLSWLPPNTGGAASDYLIDVGNGPGLSNIVAGLPFAGTSLSAPGVPVGSYFFRVRARNAAGVSGPSNEASATVGGGCTLPSAPQNFTFTKSGFNLTLSWSPPAAGGPSFIYGLQAGTTSGASNLFNGPVGSLTSVGGTVPAGAYFVRVIAANACGMGPASGELAISIP